MQVHQIFLGVNARDFAAQSRWWSNFLGRQWDREPMPGCHEWDLRAGVLFQVLDNAKGDRTTITLHIDSIDDETVRLQRIGIAVPPPARVEGFDSLRFAQFSDPENNIVGLLDGV